MSLAAVSARLLDPAGLGAFDDYNDGVTVTTGTTAFTKTAWVELMAGVAQAISGFWLTIMPDPFDTPAVTFLDIAIGAAGSEVVIVNNFYFSAGSFAYFGIMKEFLIGLPANTRIAIRTSQGNVNAKITRVFFQPMYTSVLTPNNVAVCTTIGTTGVALTGQAVVGGSGSFGTPVQLTTGLTHPVRSAHIAWFAYGSQSNHLRLSTDSAGINRVAPALFQFTNDPSHNVPLFPLNLAVGQPLYVASNSFGTVEFALYLFG